jgi:hypothetical protein
MINEDERPPDDPRERKVDKNSYILTRFKPEDLELATRVNQEDYLKGLLIETLYDLYDAHKKASAVWFNSGDDAILKTKEDLFNARNRLTEVFIFIYKLLNVDDNISLIIAIIDNIINSDADYVQDVMADIANNYITREMILRYNMRNSYGKKNRKKHKTIRKERIKRIKRKSHRRSNKRN